MKTQTLTAKCVTNKISFGRRVKTLRVYRGLNQEELAKLCGLHRTAISRIESGEVSVRIDSIFKIAKALKIKTYQLFQDEEFFDD